MAKLSGYLGSSLLRWGRQIVLDQAGSHGVVSTTISADATFDETSAMISLIDGGGSNRNVSALASCEVVGMVKVFKNTGSTNNLTLKDSAASTLATLAPGDWGVIVHNGTAWKALTSQALASVLATASTWSALQTFGAGAALKDSVSYFYDDGDATKRLAVQCSGITTGNTRTMTPPDSNFTAAATDVAQTWSAKPTFGATFAGKADSASLFVSTEQTGNGSAQNVAHGLSATPSRVLIAITNTGGVFTITEGTHTSTNVVVTVSNGVKYKVLAAL